MIWQCNACSGRWLDPQADGTRYFHVCPQWTPPPSDGAVLGPLPVGSTAPATGGGGVLPAPGPTPVYANFNPQPTAAGPTQPITLGAGATIVGG